MYCARVRINSHTNRLGLIDFMRDWLDMHLELVDRPFAAWLASH